MLDLIIKWVLIFLLVFTPIAFGSQFLWAFSLMELGILLIIILWAVQRLVYRPSVTPTSSILNPQSSIPLTLLLISLFLSLALLQMIPLPAGIIKTISPRTYELRNQLSVINPITNNQSPITTLSFFPLATKIHFFKWLALAGLFFFLLYWRLSDNRYRITHHLIIAIFLVGVFESLYGMFEFFSGRRHIFYLDWADWIGSVTGTFLNRNCFAGYLLMVIPLSIGFLFSRETYRFGRPMGWRQRLAFLDGKTLLIGFGLILMILGLILSASRGGIMSLLLSFSLMIFLFRNPTGRERFSKISVLIFGLAVLWAAWIGLDAVISRFFSAPEGLKGRWSLWVDTFAILKDFPLFGSGLGTFTEVFSMYRSSHIVGLDIQAENDFLQLASEVGLVGIGPLLLLFIFLFFTAAAGIRSLSPEEPQRYIGIGGLVGILALMFHSIVQKNLQLPANAFLYTVIWAMVLQIALDSGSERIARKETIED
jgi:hypothetical protein